jgi:ribonuclease R
LSITRLATARWEVGVHIADVSHYVRPGSALDAEAQARGTSTYLPGNVVPMLPEALSADLCSLRPDRDRLALSVLVELDASGRVHGYRFAESVIRSRHRLHYAEVQAAFDGQRRMSGVLQEALEALRPLAAGLRRQRQKAGALELEIPETKVWVDADGTPIRIERREHFESHELIEEFMLLANRCVGAEGARRGSGMLFRIHEPPAPAKLADLDQMLKALGLPRLGDRSDPARALQALVAVPLDQAHRRLLHRLVLRSLARARYAERDSGHFGLAAREYCHFTSPIRRYPDLHNHARVREWIRKLPDAAWDPDTLADLAVACSDTEQTATDAEREAVRVKGLRFLAGRLGDQASGIVTGLVPRGFFVELEDVPVEGFVRPSHDLDEPFTLDTAGVRLVGRRSRRRFTIGDRVEVIIARIDVPARECDFALVTAPRKQKMRRRR